MPKPYFLWYLGIVTLWYLGIVTGILLTGLHSLDRCMQSRFAQRQANSESAALLYLSVQACGEVAWTKYHSYGRDNKSTVTELLASFFVLYHQVLERWSRERSTGLRYDPPHMSNQGGREGCGRAVQDRVRDRWDAPNNLPARHILSSLIRQSETHQVNFNGNQLQLSISGQ